jgi:hypothetical protein
MLTPHPHAALEYWFFKVNAGPLALLVDWIDRRPLHQHCLRISIHSPHQRTVLFDTARPQIFDARTFLTPQHSMGQLGEVTWDVAIDLASERIVPDLFPANLLRVTDLTLVSAPHATFTGWIRHGPVQVELRQTPGLIAHYWGRRLAHEWWWLSANQCTDPSIAVECTVFRSGVWGLPVQIPLAYLYLRQGSTRIFAMAPPARTRVTGSPDRFTIQFQRLSAEPITLEAQGREYADLGDGIINTLVGDLEIRVGERVLARAEGTAALERRAPVAQ